MKEPRRCRACGKRIRSAGEKCRSCMSRDGLRRCRDCGGEITASAPLDAVVRGLCRTCYANRPTVSMRHNHPVPCSRCGAGTHRKSGICRACDGLKPSGKRAPWDGNPEECPTCAGLPWRRGENRLGERVADNCPTCGLPWEPEFELRVEMFARRQREEVAA